MNTRHLMQLSAVVMGAVGIAAIFLPQEIVALLVASSVPGAVIAVQLIGALYLGFAILNWMAQANLIGGIYSRPVAIGNLTHFGIGALSLLKAALAGQQSMPILVAAATYTLFAVLFGLVLFTHPVQKK